MALSSTSQDDFGTGVHRGRKAPANAVYDATNALINDEGLLFKRGGSTYYSASNAGVTLLRAASANLIGPAAERVLAWGTKGYVLDGTLAPLEIFNAGSTIGRPVGVAGALVFPYIPSASAPPSDYNQLFYYGGSLLPLGGSINVANITVTNGSTAVTKSGGTTWVGNIDAGMFLAISGSPFATVRSVDGANALSLVSPWAGATVTTGTYEISPSLIAAVGNAIPTGIPKADRVFVATGGQRLLVAINNRVYLAERGFPPAFDPDIYHELPAASTITGIQGIGDSALVFSSRGVWAISNLSLDTIDAYGNIQQTVQQISGEVSLWGDMGITPWVAGSVIVPAVDDIYVMGPDGSTTPITGDPDNEKVRRLYRSYTATSGYQPGMATTHRGHLFLPIMNGSTVVDSLVCRLDRGAVWTRWSGHAAGAAFVSRAGSDSAAPLLLGVNGLRVTNLTGTLDPTAANALEADGTTPDCVITTRDFPTGGNQHGFVQRARLRYELTDDGSGATAAPTVALAFSSDQDAGVFTTLTEKGEQGGAAGWGASAGDKYNWALVAKRRERLRLRVTVTGACASFVLRTIELLLRPSGKQ